MCFLIAMIAALLISRKQCYISKNLSSVKYFSVALLLLVFSLCSLAQSPTTKQLSLQLKKVLAEFPNDFKSLRKEVVTQNGSDVVYASTINLSGTTDNRINNFSDGSSYMATIAKGVSEKQAKTLVEEWKKKVISILGKGYEAMPYNNNDKNMLSEGYVLLGEKNSITIDRIKYESEQDFSVYLVILNK